MGNTLESWDGFKWQVRDGFIHDNIPLSKHEMAVLNTLIGISSKSKVFADIGAHVGYYTVRMVGHYKEVVAFEPNPYSIEALQTNIDINNLANVKVFQVAVGDKSEEKVLNIRQAMSTFVPVTNATITMPVKVERLDDLIEVADVIKMDVEGWEEKVILGAERIIETCQPILVIEHHDHHYAECVGMHERIKSRLYAKGYVSIGLGDIEHWVYVPREADFSPLIPLIVKCWFDWTVKNVLNGLPWYYGLPDTWWWGLPHYNFITELPKHILTAEEWIKRIIA